MTEQYQRGSNEADPHTGGCFNICHAMGTGFRGVGGQGGLWLPPLLMGERVSRGVLGLVDNGVMHVARGHGVSLFMSLAVLTPPFALRAAGPVFAPAFKNLRHGKRSCTSAPLPTYASVAQRSGLRQVNPGPVAENQNTMADQQTVIGNANRMMVLILNVVMSSHTLCIQPR